MSFYLLEIGTEEIPTSFVLSACSYFKEKFKLLFDLNCISYGEIISDGTPRRLFVYINGLPQKQDDREEVIMGPPASVVFDSNGNLTKAGLGFIKSKEIEEKDIARVTTEKGDYLQGVKRVKGIYVKDFILQNIVEIISNTPFKKSMKWGDGTFKFARPIHSFLSIFDSELLPFEIEGIKASDKTFGHRFHGKKDLQVKDFNTYLEVLRENSVIVNSEERKALILKQLNDLENEKGVKIPVDESLLEAVVNLVEYPYPVVGTFSEDFLELPDEVLITSMKVHQKYFYMMDKNGRLINSFVGISNTKPVNENVKNGYERVLRARLTDAMFFYKNDKRISLEIKAEELKKVVYQEKLGTSWEKVQRFTKVAVYLAQLLDKSKEQNIRRGCLLAKADLMTEMVYEFPELQGYMGMVYARIQGENEDIVKSINEHYKPRYAGDSLPSGFEGAVISIADKLDTICGCFVIGLIPTGNNDPYALRRNAIGILNIIRQFNFRLNFMELILNALEHLKGKAKFEKSELCLKIYDFIIQRFKQILMNDGIDGEIFDAVADNFHDIITVEKAAKEITPKRGTENFQIIGTSYKRVANILKKAKFSGENIDEMLFGYDEERELFHILAKINDPLKESIKKENFSESMDMLLSLRTKIDNFFDKVMVMDKDERIRNNRLSLLFKLKITFDQVLKFEKIN